MLVSLGRVCLVVKGSQGAWVVLMFLVTHRTHYLLKLLESARCWLGHGVGVLLWGGRYRELVRNGQLVEVPR